MLFGIFATQKLTKIMKYTLKLSACALAALCAVSLASCNGGGEQHGGADYATMIVSKSDMTLSQDYSATIRGRQDTDIYPQVSGTITQVCVKEGDVVRRGQTLFVIDQVPYKAALQMADANVQAAEAAVATAQLTADSKQKLFERGVVSDFDLQTARNALATAQAQLAQMRAAQVNAANNYSYTTVKSPSEGVVGTIPFRAGTLVSPQIQRPLTTVSDNSQMYVYFSMTENRLLDIVSNHGSMSEAVKAMPAVSLVLNNNTIYAEEGRVESVSGVINPSTGTVSLRAVFPNKGRLLHSGASGNVRMPAVYKDCIVIPKRVTYEVQDRIYVYKVVDGKAQSAEIKVAPVSTVGEYVVVGGIADGDEIVTEGVALLHNGDAVKSVTKEE